MKCVGWMGLVTLAIGASACTRSNDEEPPYGAARITVTDGDAGLASSPFVVTRVEALPTRQCSGGFPGVSEGDCSEHLAVNVSAEGRRLELVIDSRRVEGGGQAQRVEARAAEGVRLVSFYEGTGASRQSFEAGTSAYPIERSSLTVNTDGTVVIEVSAALHAARPAAGTLHVDASITIDCEAAGAGAARCQGGGGRPRP